MILPEKHRARISKLLVVGIRIVVKVWITDVQTYFSVGRVNSHSVYGTRNGGQVPMALTSAPAKLSLGSSKMLDLRQSDASLAPIDKVKRLDLSTLSLLTVRYSPEVKQKFFVQYTTDISGPRNLKFKCTIRLFVPLPAFVL